MVRVEYIDHAGRNVTHISLDTLIEPFIDRFELNTAALFSVLH